MTERNALRALGGLVVLAALLRFWRIGHQSFWLDEVFTAGLVDKGLWGMLKGVRETESTPHLYYLLAWLWAKVAGDGEGALRSLSALFGIATVPVVYLAARELFKPPAALTAAALVAVNPWFVWYSQEARAYALLVLLCGLSLALLARALRGDSARYVAWWALVAALALVTHYFAAFVVVPELVLLLWLAPARRRATLAAGAFVGAVGVALIPLAVYQAGRGHDRWIERIALSKRLRDTGEQFVLGYSGSPARALSIVVALLVVVAAALALWHGRTRRGFWLAAGVGVAALAIPLLAKLAGADYLYPRNMVGAWVPLAVALGVAVAVVPPIGGQVQPREWSRAGAAAIAAVCAAFLALVIAVDADTDLQRADWRGAARAIGPPAETRALVVPAIGDDPVSYYARGKRLPRGSATVREIDVLGFSAAPLPRDRRVPDGFRQVSRRAVGRFTLVRYRAPGAERLGRPELAAARLGIGHAAVVVQAP